MAGSNLKSVTLNWASLASFAFQQEMIGLVNWFSNPMLYDGQYIAAINDIAPTHIRLCTYADIYQWNPPANNNAAVVAASGSTYKYLTTGYGPGTGNAMVTPASIDALFNNFVTKLAGNPALFLCCNYGTNAAGTAGNSSSDVAALVDYVVNNNLPGSNPNGLTTHPAWPAPLYWQFGNEQYGTGQNLNAAKDGTTYGNDMVTWTNAIKAKYASARVVPSVYGRGQIFPEPTGRDATWTQHCLTACASSVYGFDFHYFPYYSGATPQWNEQELVRQGNQIPGLVSTMKSLISGAGGNPNHLFCLAMGITSDYPSEPWSSNGASAVGCADMMLQGLDSGLQGISWFNSCLQSTNTSYAGVVGYSAPTSYQDDGIISDGNIAGGPAKYTYNPTAYALKLLGIYARPGYTPVTGIYVPDQEIAVHGCVGGGQQRTLIVNRHATMYRYVTITNSNSVNGNSTMTVYLYQPFQNGGIVQYTLPAAASYTLEIPPYSIMVTIQ